MINYCVGKEWQWWVWNSSLVFDGVDRQLVVFIGSHYWQWMQLVVMGLKNHFSSRLSLFTLTYGLVSNFGKGWWRVCFSSLVSDGVDGWKVVFVWMLLVVSFRTSHKSASFGVLLKSYDLFLYRVGYLDLCYDTFMVCFHVFLCNKLDLFIYSYLYHVTSCVLAYTLVFGPSYIIIAQLQFFLYLISFYTVSLYLSL